MGTLQQGSVVFPHTHATFSVSDHPPRRGRVHSVATDLVVVFDDGQVLTLAGAGGNSHAIAEEQEAPDPAVIKYVGRAVRITVPIPNLNRGLAREYTGIIADMYRVEQAVASTPDQRGYVIVLLTGRGDGLPHQYLTVEVAFDFSNMDATFSILPDGQYPRY